jgi:outer membrane protein assembly factor BamB
MVCDGGNLKAYTWQGRPLWSYYAGGKLLPFVTRSREGTSYICRTNGVLAAVNRSGRELWRIELGENPAYPLLAGWDGRLFVFTEKKITCYTASGFTLWSRAFDKKISLKPAMDVSGGFFLVLEDGEFLRFDPFGGFSSYKLEALPAAAVSLKSEEPARVFLLVYQGRSGELLRLPLDSAGGSRETLAAVRFTSAPLAAAGSGSEAAVLLADGQVALFSSVQKKLLWTGNSQLSVGKEGSAASEDFTLFFDERGVYALTRTGAAAFTGDGRRLWLIKLRGAAALPAFSDEGVLYSGGGDWILYAYRLEERVRSQRKLLYGPAPEGSYGTGSPGPSPWANDYFRFSERDMLPRFDEINLAIQQGAVGVKEKEYAAWLMEVAGSLVENPRTGNHPPVQVQHRVEAARLLAYIGSRETIPFLAGLFSDDPDPLVKAAAAESIGRIGVDPEGLALRAFSNAVFPPLPLRDEAALTAIAAAAGALCRFSGPPLSDTGIRLLTVLAAREQPPPVRNRAEQELRSLGR